jgi:serine/threonine protein kinase
MSEASSVSSFGFQVIEDALDDRYKILEKIGGKGLTLVYKAKDNVLGRTVAIKSIFFNAFAPASQLELEKTRFYREVEVSSQLLHPNIVTLHDVVTKPASAFIVMAFVEGENLRSVLASKKRLELTQCIDIITDIAKGLDYAHEKKIIHRNVKPANITVKSSSGAALTEFSLALTDTPSKFNVAARIVGTPAYMSPEAARGEPLDARSDLFSLGCIFYECLAGVRPFRGKGPEGVLEHVKSPEPAPPLDWIRLGLPTELDPVIQKVLAKVPAQRFGSGAALIEALKAIPVNGAKTATTVLEEAEPPKPIDPKKLRMLQEEERPLCLSSTISDDLQSASLSSEEGFVLSRIDGTSRPRDILAVSPLGEEETTRALLGMLERGLLRFDDAEVKPEKPKKVVAKEKEPQVFQGVPEQVPRREEEKEAKPETAPDEDLAYPNDSDRQATEESSGYDSEKHAHELFVHAEKAYELEDYWQAIQLCRQAVEVRGDVPKYHYVLGMALLRNKKWRKEAAESIRSAAELEPSNPEYLGTLGALYQAEGLHLRAKKVLEQVKSIAPDYEIPDLPV